MNTSVVRIFESELACIAHETSINPNIETGGSLYGLWTDAGNPTVVLASRPGPRAIRQPTQFEQDSAAHQAIERVLINGFGAQAVGLWHSHHRLGLHELSGGDINRTTQFARRTSKNRFCDLLSYFDNSDRWSTSSSEVTVKPYVYVDAGHGTRAPTSIVVLPGISPVRSALAADMVMRQVLEEFRLALAAPPGNWQPLLRLARSVELGARDDEDAPAQPKRWISFRRKKSRPAVAEQKHPGSDSTEASVAESAQPVEDPMDFAIVDPVAYVSKYLEPELRFVPDGVTCELEPIADGRALRLTLLSSSRTEEHVLDLGWDTDGPVVIGHVCRRAQQSTPTDLLPDDDLAGLRQRLEQVFRALADSRRRK